MKFLLLSIALTLSAGPVMADPVSDAISEADDAYASGDLAATSKALRAALGEVDKIRGAELAKVLPAAPEGFTRTETADFSMGMAMLGGGTGAEASYAKDDVSFTLSIIADNDMVSGMMGMFSDASMLAMMGTVEAVGDVNIVTAADGSIMTIAAGRYMISASGAPAEVMMPLVKAIDFDKLTEMAGQ